MLDLLEKHLLLHTLVGGITPVELTFSFDHRFCCLLIRAELVNLNLGALVVEVGKTLERFCLAVELYDGLHDNMCHQLYWADIVRLSFQEDEEK